MKSIADPANGRKPSSSQPTAEPRVPAGTQPAEAGLSPPAAAAPEAPPDPFDPARLRLTQDFASGAGVAKVIVNIPVRKPAKEWFLRTHPEAGFWIDTYVLDLKEDREMYLVDPALWPSLATEPTFGPRQLVPAVSRQGHLFLWPIRLPGPDGKIDDWNRSALEAVKLAREKWVRVAANMSAGQYDVSAAQADIPGPDWSSISLQEILKIAFKGKLIESPDHAVLKRLRGEV